MKKKYIIPCFEVIEFSVENIIAASLETGDQEVDGGDGFSNKRQPMNNSWGSQNWNKDGE